MKKLYLLFLLTAISCAPTIKNFSSYQKQFISKSQFLPTQADLDQKQSKVVVFAFDENENEVAKQASLGVSIANNVENILSKSRMVQLVDRSAAKKLEKEIQLAEMNKTGSYKGPQVADFAMSGSISDASFSSQYNSAQTYFDAKSKTFVNIPANYTYKSVVGGNIKIYELPSMSVVQNIDFKGIKKRVENVRQNGGLSLGGLQIGGTQADGATRDDGLVRRAGEVAIEDVIEDIKNVLVQKGYILEKRVFEDKTIFKISLGSQNGIAHGDKFDIVGTYESENSITGKVENESRIIVSGVVADKIDPKSAWVVLDDAKKINDVRLGDVVKMKYKKSRFASIMKMAQNMGE